jgi:hypothetical protein
MKIDYEFIKNIFNRKIEIKNQKDKILLSQYADYIPMYDIYSDMIYPISSVRLYYRLVECHYRFITDEVKQWIINKSEDATEEKKKKYNDMIKILDNYDLEILEKTSYETLYRYAPDFGMSISICKRNSFHPYARHLTPYYSKSELIKLGMNNKLIEELTPEKLIDKKLHYQICKLVSKNDVSYITINEHMKHIIDNKAINWIVYYSLTGSYIFNKILRENLPIYKYMYSGLSKIMKTMEMSELPKDYYFYRFVWNDDFIKHMRVGDIFKDNGFISTTRDPFYSPGMKMDFGLVLVRINVPKHVKGVGLLMENFSMFPKEEEFLLHPGSQLKLIAKDDKATYYHTDSKFERAIRKRYEFTYIGYEDLKLKILPDSDIPEIDLYRLDLDSYDRIGLFKQFLQKCDINGQFRFNKMIFTSMWFDSTGSYERIYKNKTKDGFTVNYYMNGYPALSIEMGEIMCVSYINTKCPYDDDDYTIPEFDDIVAHFGRIFKYKQANVYFKYKTFAQFKDNYKDNIEYTSIRLYCDTIYQYFNKTLTYPKYYKFDYGFWHLDKMDKIMIDTKILNKLPKDLQKKISWKELFIIIVEKHFYLYPRLEEWMNEYHNDLFKKNYFTFNIISHLNKLGYDMVEIPAFKHVATFDRGAVFDTIYNDTIRRV